MSNKIKEILKMIHRMNENDCDNYFKYFESNITFDRLSSSKLNRLKNAIDKIFPHSDSSGIEYYPDGIFVRIRHDISRKDLLHIFNALNITATGTWYYSNCYLLNYDSGYEEIKIGFDFNTGVRIYDKQIESKEGYNESFISAIINFYC